MKIIQKFVSRGPSSIVRSYSRKEILDAMTADVEKDTAKADVLKNITQSYIDQHKGELADLLEPVFKKWLPNTGWDSEKQAANNHALASGVMYPFLVLHFTGNFEMDLETLLASSPSEILNTHKASFKITEESPRTMGFAGHEQLMELGLFVQNINHVTNKSPIRWLDIDKLKSKDIEEMGKFKDWTGFDSLEAYKEVANKTATNKNGNSDLYKDIDGIFYIEEKRVQTQDSSDALEALGVLKSGAEISGVDYAKFYKDSKYNNAVKSIVDELFPHTRQKRVLYHLSGGLFVGELLKKLVPGDEKQVSKMGIVRAKVAEGCLHADVHRFFKDGKDKTVGLDVGGSLSEKIATLNSDQVNIIATIEI